MMINHIICTSKILTDLCFTKQKIEVVEVWSRSYKFVEVVYSVLVMKMCW